MKLLLSLLVAVTSAASAPGQASPTSAIWIYDCSQSHSSVLAPPPMERFGITSRPIDELARVVADNKGPATEVRVLNFGQTLVLSPQWMRTRDQILTALECGTALNGPSPIWDAVYRAAEVLEERTGRREIVMVTDGKSTANEHSFQDALDRAKQAGVRIHIGLARMELFRTSRQPVTLNANHRGDPAARLKQLADATGGRYAEHSVWGLTTFFTDVARDWQK